MHRVTLLITFLSAGCTPPPLEMVACRCDGNVPEGRLSAVCGETQCVGGVGYRCTGVNTAVAVPDSCAVVDASVPEDDAGAPHDAGTIVRPDAGTHVDSGMIDAGCTTSLYYRDSDSDGYGDPADSMQACSAPSGYVSNGSDCAPSVGAVHPGAVELCDSLDNDCDGTSAACSSFPGTYTGHYEIYTAERLGSTVINEMRCVGTSSITINVSASPALTGTVACDYAGGLTAFSAHQTGTLQGDVRPDGTISGRVTHQFASGSQRTFNFSGPVDGSAIHVTGTGSWYPNSASAVPWSVNVTIDGTR
jgi:hypothetical protein